ncbi:hypothetical protein FRC12_022630 [Ceratobasidium sp. 428]|nr:hypothetical protein FRC12_022630 [Ceratobasidium sp. 428]
MVIFNPRSASLLAFVVSSSIVIGGVGALPQTRQVLVGSAGVIQSRVLTGLSQVKPRGHHHHHHHHHGHHGHHHHSHKYDSGRTKLYADDPLVISGDGNHVHAHIDKRHHGHHHHGDHHHGHHGTKVYADDPLIVSGNGNHIHAHSHKRGIVDPLIPLLCSVPGLPGIIDLVNVASHAVLSEKLASLIISPNPSDVNAQSTTGENGAPGFVISASNTSSSVMYLLPQNTSTSLAPPEQVVLITMPMFDETKKGLKMYCASYDPRPSAPVQISAEPCTAGSTPAPNGNTTSQLFSWNTQSGEITPLWHKDSTQPLVDTTSAPGGASDPASQVNHEDGFVVGQSMTSTGSSQAPSGTVAMVFHAVSEEDVPLTSTQVSAQVTSTVAALEASTAVLSMTETATAAGVSSTPSIAPSSSAV